MAGNPLHKGADHDGSQAAGLSLSYFKLPYDYYVGQSGAENQGAGGYRHWPRLSFLQHAPLGSIIMDRGDDCARGGPDSSLGRGTHRKGTELGPGRALCTNPKSALSGFVCDGIRSTPRRPGILAPGSIRLFLPGFLLPGYEDRGAGIIAGLWREVSLLRTESPTFYSEPQCRGRRFFHISLVKSCSEPRAPNPGNPLIYRSAPRCLENHPLGRLYKAARLFRIPIFEKLGEH